MGAESPLVKSATRVLDILELLASASAPIGASEVARKLDIPRSSAHVLLLTLEDRNYVLSDSARRYLLSPALRGPAYSWVGGLRSRLLDVAQKVMQRLVDKVDETAFLCVLSEREESEYIAKVLCSQEVRCDAQLHAPRAIHSNSPGQVLMAFQSDEKREKYLQRGPFYAFTTSTLTEADQLRAEFLKIRQAGVAMTRDTNTVGVSGLSAPILGPSGEVVASLNLSVPSSRFPKSVEALMEAVRSAADQISLELAKLDAGSDTHVLS